jgi:hypothetical protein
VGLKPIATELMEVWFGRLLLGQVDVAASSFIGRIPAWIKRKQVAAIHPNKTANETQKV